MLAGRNGVDAQRPADREGRGCFDFFAAVRGLLHRETQRNHKVSQSKLWNFSARFASVKSLRNSRCLSKSVRFPDHKLYGMPDNPIFGFPATSKLGRQAKRGRTACHKQMKEFYLLSEQSFS